MYRINCCTFCCKKFIIIYRKCNLTEIIICDIWKLLGHKSTKIKAPVSTTNVLWHHYSTLILKNANYSNFKPFGLLHWFHFFARISLYNTMNLRNINVVWCQGTCIVGTRSFLCLKYGSRNFGNMQIIYFVRTHDLTII